MNPRAHKHRHTRTHEHTHGHTYEHTRTYTRNTHVHANTHIPLPQPNSNRPRQTEDLIEQVGSGVQTVGTKLHIPSVRPLVQRGCFRVPRVPSLRPRRRRFQRLQVTTLRPFRVRGEVSTRYTVLGDDWGLLWSLGIGLCTVECLPNRDQTRQIKIGIPP